MYITHTNIDIYIIVLCNYISTSERFKTILASLFASRGEELRRCSALAERTEAPVARRTNGAWWK